MLIYVLYLCHADLMMGKLIESDIMSVKPGKELG